MRFFRNSEDKAEKVNHSEAIKFTKSALNLIGPDEVDNVEAYVHLATLANDAVKASPDDKELRQSIATILMKCDITHEIGFVHLTMALVMDSSDATSLRLLAVALKRVGLIEDAKFVLAKAWHNLGLSRKDFEGDLNLAKVKYMNIDYL